MTAPQEAQQEAKAERRRALHTRTDLDSHAQAARTHRETERERRDLAEQWWQALRKWEVQPGETITAYYGNPKPSGMRLVGIAIGGGVSSSYQTEIELVSLPCGLREAALVGQLCAANPHLAELYRGAGLATLIHSNGRGWASQRARECGEAVLQLADSLGGINHSGL